MQAVNGLDPWRVLGGVIGAVLISLLSWGGGCITERYTVAEDVRREVKAHGEQLKAHNAILVTLPVDDLKKLPAKVERIEAASDGMRDSVERMERALRGSPPRTFRAGGRVIEP
ncbi:MAG TPA: hypothetical protein VFR62_14720 [Gemmatimonadales bacterium]|nr:hypothetical protein [Gemmatimonadales bacterium]